MSSVLVSIIVYSFIAFVMSIFASLANINSKRRYAGMNSCNSNEQIMRWYSVAGVCLTFSVFSGMRWYVGVDYQFYLENYMSLKAGGPGTFTFEFGFQLVSELLAKLGLHFFFYFFLIALLQSFTVYWAYREDFYLWPLFSVLLIFNMHFILWMNGMRQMLAATIFVYATRYIGEGKLFSYFALIVIASLIHKSALILLPFYFLFRLDFFRNQIITISVLCVSFALGILSDSLDYFSDIMRIILDLIGYDRYFTNFEEIGHAEVSRSFGPRRLSLFLAVLIITFYSKSLFSYYGNNRFKISYNASIIGTIYYNLFFNSHLLILRPTVYFTIFYLPLFAYFMYFLFKKKMVWIFLLFSCLSMLYLPISLIADVSNSGNDYTNYKFFWSYEN